MDSITWSLVCELVYYTLYPVIRKSIAKPKGYFLLGLGFTAAFVLIFTSPTEGNYPSFGIYWNWILGFPCWLLGCLLAERIHSNAIDRYRHRINYSFVLYRVSIFLAAFFCSVLRFHTPLGYPWTLDLFAFLVVFWLKNEIECFKDSKIVRIFEWAGTWSYSLYLTHLLPLYFARQIDANITLAGNVSILILTFAFAYFFYLIVELPSHRLAGKLAGRFLQKY